MPSSLVYIGIDVACALGKKLPICWVSAGCPLTPLEIPRRLAQTMPRGLGNKEITSATPFQEAALGVVSTIKRVIDETGWKVGRIAIDAPAAPPAIGSRKSEAELGSLGLSSFRTPVAAEWTGIRKKCAKHLSLGGTAATLPFANKIWMLFGFELFAALRSAFDVEAIEVYPFAIVRALLSECEHKSTENGYRDQLAAVAVQTGWEPRNLEANLKATVPGSRHDRLDAFMAAWVASTHFIL